MKDPWDPSNSLNDGLMSLLYIDCLQNHLLSYSALLCFIPEMYEAVNRGLVYKDFGQRHRRVDAILSGLEVHHGAKYRHK
jgi:hypothetical protein